MCCWAENAEKAADGSPAEADAERAYRPIGQVFNAFIVLYPPAREGTEGVARSVKEYAYNLIDGCKRHIYDADAELFLEVLSERMPEDTHAKAMAMLDALRTAFVDADAKENNGLCRGSVKKKSAATILRKAFPTRSDAQIASMVGALEREQPGLKPDDAVRYGDLFKEDREGNQTAFIERVRDQWLRAPRTFVHQVGAGLSVHDAACSGFVTIGQARDAIQGVDPKKPLSEVRALVAVGVGVPPSAGFAGMPHDDTKVEIRLFCSRLLAAAPSRSGKAPETKRGGLRGSPAKKGMARMSIC